VVPVSGEREARMSRDSGGDPLGVMIYLTAEELQELGVDPRNADKVTYATENGTLRVGGDTA